MKLLRTLLLLPLLTACAPDVESFKDVQPKLDIREYLNGTLKAHGMIYDWRGRPSRHFTATIKASWEGNKGTLDEVFHFSDGTTDTRVWTLQFSDEHHFQGTAGDVKGIAKGSQYGNAVNFDYVLNHKQEDGSTIALSVDDWMYLTADNVLLNRSYLRKFGLPVGEVQIAFTKESHE